jgi:peptide methionine sulfoxide reductase msrA/msrB
MKIILIGALLASALHAKEESIIFAAGCFWGVEKAFEQKKGVLNVVSGYSGGSYKNPTYHDVLKNRITIGKGDDFKNHTEVVKVTFDNDKVSAEKLIKDFWELHDPTQKNRQGNDVGNNYRSAIYYTNTLQKQAAFRTKDVYQSLLFKEGFSNIKTEILPLDKFYKAEKFHQDYLKRNPNGYCPNHSTGVKFEKTNIVEKQKNLLPIIGKEILVIESDGYCPYCEKLKEDVLNSYKGDIKLSIVKAKQLKKFKFKKELENASPIIMYVQDGVEVTRHLGYMNEKQFYKALGEFKLQKGTLAYKIAFENGTESSFCKAYDIFKNTPDGVFKDKVSGEILFDTKDRFISRSGWLSFYKAQKGSTIELPDNRYGMKRIEVKAKKSGIHLGHVFPKANGKRRFCINANVLDFVKRENL